MKVFYCSFGMAAIFRLSQVLCAYFKFDPKAVTIIANCAIPILAIFVVMLVNEFKRQICLIVESEDGE